MSFNRNRWTRVSLADNTGAITLDDASVVNGPALFTYQSAADSLATIAAANYFASAVYDLAVGDFIIVNGSDGSNMYVVATIDREAETITVTSFSTSASVATANIQDAAVTTAKLDPSTIQYAVVSMTAAEWQGMYAAPKLLVAAPGANKQILVHAAKFLATYVSAQYTSGGAVHVQYDSTANGAGSKASGTISAASINGIAANSTFELNGAEAVSASSTTINKGLYLSNATGAFATGDSTFKVAIWYSVADFT